MVEKNTRLQQRCFYNNVFDDSELLMNVWFITCVNFFRHFFRLKLIVELEHTSYHTCI